MVPLEARVRDRRLLCGDNSTEEDEGGFLLVTSTVARRCIRGAEGKVGVVEMSASVGLLPALCPRGFEAMDRNVEMIKICFVLFFLV